LILTGVKLMFVDGQEQEDFTQKPYVRFLAKHLRVDPHLHGHNFFVRLPNPKMPNKSLIYATPLFLCLCTIEVTDVMFAFDSVPAAFAVTKDPYTIYTANIFAILGLRAMFFAMEHILHRFHYLKYSLSIVLIFIGLKVFYNHVFEPIPGPVSLAITFGVLLAGVVISMIKTRHEKDTEHMTEPVEHK
jgi:tellurite resistance protein TerC